LGLGFCDIFGLDPEGIGLLLHQVSLELKVFGIGHETDYHILAVLEKLDLSWGYAFKLMSADTDGIFLAKLAGNSAHEYLEESRLLLDGCHSCLLVLGLGR
jgi:hypothetical protein